MPSQTNATGQIIQGNDPDHPTPEQVLEYLRQSLISNGWVGQVSPAVRAVGSRGVKFLAEISKAETTYNLDIFVFRNLAWAHRRDSEKRIQLTENYEHHADDFRRPYEGGHYCLLLGVYAPSPGEVVFCAWKPSGYIDHANPTSCYTTVEVIRDAYLFGFGSTLDKKQRRTYAFRPDFFHYYISNIASMHADGAVANPPEELEDDGPDDARLVGGSNVIRYGAPGTGKSYAIDQEIVGHRNFRTVFHPTLEQSDFFGSLKPVVVEERVQYRFVPGPFCLALADALNNPAQRVNLIIEELNRGPAAAIFGDTFLLLDRQSDGGGVYDIASPSPEFAQWFATTTGNPDGRVRMPSNLWLLATMNSADQGVFPLDTAFRRRWSQNYEPLNFAHAPDVSFNVVRQDGSNDEIPWRVLAMEINSLLTQRLTIPEDRLLGPWFVKAEDRNADGAIPGKVLLYLWDDVLRHHGREEIFSSDVQTYGELILRMSGGHPILSNNLLARLAEKVVASGPAAVGAVLAAGNGIGEDRALDQAVPPAGAPEVQ
ncbi:MAG: hypothetical protein C0436_03690 [Alphaproteobacteria bacterium]|nr:hypothetical protein [Alphaproteobacteria bacterium]